MISGGALSSIPGLQSVGPWIADLSGILVVFLMPAIRLKPKPGSGDTSKLQDLEGPSTSNPVLAVIEDSIRDRILARMQLEVIAATRLYNWDTIRLAAYRALEEEMTIRPLGNNEYDAMRQVIDNFQINTDSGIDSRNKYEALLHILRWCSFKRLRNGLETAARESHA
jgi:hypothetical protein